MPSANNDNKLIWSALGILILIPVLQLGVSRLFSNNWGLSHWQYFPWWFGLVWAVATAAAVVIVLQCSKRLQTQAISRPVVGVATVIAFALIILFRFDSFVSGAGNIRVAEIAQRDYLLVRWFEYGSFYAVHVIYKLLSILSLDSNTAGVWGWRILSFVAALTSLIGSIKIAGLISRDTGRRVVLVIMLFLGPQVLPLFGFVGYSAAVVAVTIWFSYFALRTLRGNSVMSLLPMWGMVLAGLFLHISLVYLIPAAIFVTMRKIVKGANGTRVGSIVAMLSFASMIIALYILAVTRLEWLNEILLFAGKNPFSDYGIFSLRHVGDMLQLLIGYAPMVILAVILGLIVKIRSKSDGSLAFAAILTVSGLAVAFIIDPSNGILSDAPILVAYLFGVSLIASLLCERLWSQIDRVSFSPALVAALAFGSFLAYAPAYVRIANADPYLTDYYDKHKEYYSTTCFAFRDAYFYNGDLDKANAWEMAVRHKSDYYINITGISNLMQSDDNNEALRTLRWVRSEFPYRAEPQQLTATAQLNLHRYALAKPHIDTCFMLQPYNRDHFRSLYIYYRDQQRYPEAVQTLKRALSIFTGDLDFTVDMLISYYRMADYVTADSLCNAVLEVDPQQPYPYFIRALIAEMGGLPGMATVNYQKFIELAPDEPEAEYARNRLDSLAPARKP